MAYEASVIYQLSWPFDMQIKNPLGVGAYSTGMYALASAWTFPAPTDLAAFLCEAGGQ